MKNMWKVFFAALLLLAGVTGCTSVERPGQEEEPTILTYMGPTYGSNYYAGKQQIEWLCEERSDIQILVQTYSEEQYYTVLKTKLATGNGPDLFFVQPGYAGANGIFSLAEAGYLEPVTELPFIQESSRKLLGCGNEIYTVSEGWMALGVLYNKEIFDEYQLEEPTCWQEFLSICEILKEQEILPLIVSGKDKNTIQYGLYQIAANRIYAENPQYDEELRTGKVRFTDEGTWDQVICMYTGLYDAGYMGEHASLYTQYEAGKRFKNGEAAMIFATGGEAASLSDDDPNAYGFFPLPANESDETVLWCMGEVGGIGIYSGTKEPELCKELLETYFWQEEASSAAQDYTDDSFSAMRKAYEDGQYVPLCNQGWSNEVEAVLESMVGGYLAGREIKPEDIAAAMQERLEN